MSTTDAALNDTAPPSRHPADCGACDPETACEGCALAYALQEVAEADAAMVEDEAADARREEQGP